MKRIVYIISFTILGVLFQLLIHGIVEIWYINLLISDYQSFGLGLTWDDWLRIHDAGAVVLAFGGLIAGYLLGRYWWRQIYVLHRYGKKW